MTLQQWVEKGEAQLLAGPHPERARRDSELLLLHVIRRERAGLLARWKEVLPEDEAANYIEMLARRAAGEPMQYIFGETEFYGLPFRVTRDVLIPRPETEHLVEAVLHKVSALAAPRIADVGTGSGAIAVALGHALPLAILTAIDFSQRALLLAEDNARRNGVAGRIRFLRGSILTPAAGERFDIIVSNPPYVPAGDRATLTVEVREHEPGLALFAGADGLDVIRRLIPEALAALVPGGCLAMEFGFGQQPAVSSLLQAAGFAEIEFTADLQGIPRVACAQRT